MDTDRWEEKRQRWEQKMDARRTRWEDRMSRRRYHSGSSGVFFGAIVVVIGLLLLLDNLGIFRFHDVWQYWPVLLVAWGVSRVVDSRTPSGWIWGAVVTLVGAFFLLDNLGILDSLGIRVFDWAVVWPVLLIAFGVSVLARAFEHHGIGAGGGPQYPSSPVVNTQAFFSDNKGGTDAKDFQGGQATAVCGAARFDLRNASMTVDEAIIDVNVVFGEAEVRMPETWIVINRAAVVFGGVNDKTNQRAPDPNVKTPRLVITGSVLFGGLTLRN